MITKNHEILEKQNNQPDFAFQEEENNLVAKTGENDNSWNLPEVFFFLARLRDINIFNFKVNKIVKKITESLDLTTNFFGDNINKLMLLISMECLLRTGTNNNNHEINGNIDRYTVIESGRLEEYIKRIKVSLKEIKDHIGKHNELNQRSERLINYNSVQYWFYEQLYQNAGFPSFESLMSTYPELYTILNDSCKTIPIFTKYENNKHVDLGLWNGLAGFGMQLISH